MTDKRKKRDIVFSVHMVIGSDPEFGTPADKAMAEDLGGRIMGLIGRDSAENPEVWEWAQVLGGQFSMELVKGDDDG